MLTVKFNDYNGNTIDEQQVEYGKKVAYVPADLAGFETETTVYSFEKWVADIAEVTTESDITFNVTFTAQMKAEPKTFKVTFLNDDNTVIKKDSKEYDYGTVLAS